MRKFFQHNVRVFVFMQGRIGGIELTGIVLRVGWRSVVIKHWETGDQYLVPFSSLVFAKAVQRWPESG